MKGALGMSTKTATAWTLLAQKDFKVQTRAYRQPHCKKMDILLTVTAQSGWQFPVSQSNHINHVFVSKPGGNNSSKEMTEDVVIVR